MLGFLLRFSWRDLTAREALRTTFPLLGTVCLVVAFPLGGFGFIEGSRQVGLYRLQEEDPFARCLWTGDNIVKKRISPEVLNDLRRKILQVVPSPEYLDGIHPFYESTLTFKGKSGATLQLTGRTIRLPPEDTTSDPLFKSRPVQNGPGLKSSKDQGIVFTPQGLLRLGYKTTDKLDTVILHTNTGSDVPIKVRGIIKKDLPTPHDFIVTEPYERKLQAENPDPVMSIASSTPFPENWPTSLDKFPPRVLQLLETANWDLASYQVEPYFDPDPDVLKNVTVLRLKSEFEKGDRQRPPTLSEWNARFERIQELMVEVHPTEEPFRVNPKKIPIKQILPRVNHDMLAVYVSPKVLEEDLLVAVADACESVQAGERPLEVNRTIVDQVRSINEQTRQIQKVLAWSGGLLVVFACGMLFVIQRIRAEQRIAEIGMLKAMGMTRRSLVLLDLLEGFLLCAPAVLAGVGVAAAGEYAVSAWVHSGNPEHVQRGFFWSPLWAVGAALGSGLVFLFFSWWANHRARTKSPSSALQSSN